MRPRRRAYLIDEHENLERWLLSYADFITLLFAFFVLMYATSSIDAEKYKALSTSLGTAFIKQDLDKKEQAAQANHLDQALDKPLEQVAENLRQSLKPMIDEGLLRIIENNEGIAIEIKDSALFDSGKASLSYRSVQTLANIAKPLRPIHNNIRVEGFTDNVPIKSTLFPSNWELSAARAGSVVRLFTEQGIAAPRLVAMGHAENKPVASNKDTEGRAHNRRVAISILK